MAKSVKPEQKGTVLQTELAKREVLRLNNRESNHLTRECICMAMMYLMNEKPYDSISISEIAKRAGVSRTAEIVGKVRSNEDVHNMFVEFFTQIEQQKDKIELLIKGDLSFNLLFPNARILENVIPARTRTEHYRMVAVDAALFGIVKEWITNGCDLSVEELVRVVELGVSI